MSAGQAFLAYALGYPEIAKKDRARVFGDLYDSVFNDGITCQKLLIPLKVFSEIEARKRSLQRQIKRKEAFDTALLFLIDGAYHALFTVAELCESKNIDPFDETKVMAKISEALDLLKKLVKREAAQDEAFTASRFFKDAKTKGKIQRMIAESKTGRTRASTARAATRP